MPIYEWSCLECGKRIEQFISVKDVEEKIPCDCGGVAYRIISPCSFQLKGNPEGWYKPAAKDPTPTTPTTGGLS